MRRFSFFPSFFSSPVFAVVLVFPEAFPVRAPFPTKIVPSFVEIFLFPIFFFGLWALARRVFLSTRVGLFAQMTFFFFFLH